MQKLIKPLVLLFLSIFMIFSYQNCSEFKVIPAMELSSKSANSLAEIKPIPDSDKVDANCMTSDEFDACLFRKNPVAQARQGFSETLSYTTDLSSVQTFGVKLPQLAGASLANNYISIERSQGAPLEVSSANLKMDATGDNQLRVAQLNAFYWSSRTLDYLSQWTNALPEELESNQIKIIVDDKMTGYASDTKTIHLRVTDDGNIMAYNGGVVIYLMGHAIADIATDGAINNLTGTTKHRACGADKFGCCVDNNGCSKAIVNGIGESLVAMFFPLNPTMGETWSNSAQSPRICSIERSPANRILDKNVAFDSCTDNGNIHLMGTLYAAIWRKIRLEARKISLQAMKDVDTLFVKHISEVTTEDSFTTMRTKILDLDERQFNGDYGSIINNAFIDRGYN